MKTQRTSPFVVFVYPCNVVWALLSYCNATVRLSRGVETKFGVGGQPAMVSVVARAYNRVQGAEPPVGVQGKLKKTFSICTSSRSGKFVIFSVYLQYFARASMDWLSVQWCHLALLACPASVVCLCETDVHCDIVIICMVQLTSDLSCTMWSQ